MLQTTLHTATHRLGEKPAASTNLSLSASYNVAMNTMTNTQFACKILAVLYWRLPYVGAAISQIMEIPNMELIAPVLSFPAFPSDIPAEGNTTPVQNINNNNNNNAEPAPGGNLSSTPPSTVDSNNAQNVAMTPRTRRGASLFGWPQLYKDLPPITDPIVPPSIPIPSPSSTLSNSTSALPSLSGTPPSSSPLSSSALVTMSPSPWLTVMAKFDVTYITFFKEWILHVKYV